MPVKKKIGINTASVAAALASIALVTTALLTPSQENTATTYSISQVIDGDTLELSTGQKIRLSNVEAPEINLCGGAEAKAILESLIKDNKILFKFYWIDSFQRLVGDVYSGRVHVNKAMLASGFSTYHSRDTDSADPKLKSMVDSVRSQKKGGVRFTLYSIH